MPWIQGSGDLIVGDHVRVEGLLQVFFAARYHERPQLIIGDHTGLGHQCSIVVGRLVSIGKHCRFGASIRIFDSPGHPADPVDRQAGLPAREEDVRPVHIGDNVWIGTGAVIFPGVTIGDNSVVASGSVVVSDVPRDVIVAGNPARRVQTLQRDETQAS